MYLLHWREELCSISRPHFFMEFGVMVSFFAAAGSFLILRCKSFTVACQWQCLAHCAYLYQVAGSIPMGSSLLFLRIFMPQRTANGPAATPCCSKRHIGGPCCSIQFAVAAFFVCIFFMDWFFS